MNYLTHLFFSKRTPLSFVGNMMGDFKRLADAQELPLEVTLGIKNHRFVDKVTDTNADVKALKLLFSKERRRYSAVILDIAFDYYLIKHWHRFEEIKFEQFTTLCYEGLLANMDIMPERMQYVVKNMCEHDWLSTYASFDGLAQTIDHVSQRIRFENKMAGAIEEIKRHDEQIDRVFCVFFPLLIDQVKSANIEGDYVSV